MDARPANRSPYDLTWALVVRIAGEIALKSNASRKMLERRLQATLVDAMRRAGHHAHIERTRNRIYLYTDASEAAEVCARVFGVQGVGLTKRHAWQTVDDIVAQAVELHAERVAGKTFAVRVRRVGQRERFHTPLSTMEVARRLGTALLEHAASVDLDHPEVTVRLEVTPDLVWHYADDELPGPGGMPLEEQERALALISGGFDSSVAAWHTMRRGSTLDFLFFNLAGDAHLRGAAQVLDRLASRWIHGVPGACLHVVDLRPVVARIKTETPNRFWQVLLKRAMMLAADQLGVERNYLALVTGEALGQVSTQTLGNLAAIGRNLTLPVLRPLTGANKTDIVDQSRIVGTHDLSANNPEYCSLDAGRVMTRVRPDLVDELIDAVGVDAIRDCVAQRETVLLTGLGELLARLDRPSLEVGDVPDGATVLDLRSPAGFEGWHYPDSLHMPFDVALAALDRLPTERHYVLVCEVGLKSAMLAERLRARGVSAHNFAGGLKGLMRWARRQGVDTGELLESPSP